MNVQLVIMSQGYVFAMFENGELVATGQGPLPLLPGFVGRLAADANFAAVSYSGPLEAPPEKFAGDLSPGEATALAAKWRELSLPTPPTAVLTKPVK